MSDKNAKNQDSDLDKNPENNKSATDAVSVEPSIMSKEDEDLLSEIEGILNEEDPDFLNELATIDIDNEAVDLSLLDKALSIDIKDSMSLLGVIRKPFELKSNSKQVLAFWSLLILIVTVGVIVWNYKGDLFHQKLFLTSYAEIGSDITDYNPMTDVEPFYDNIYFAKNLITISAMHANLKSSENSGVNPMLALEVTVEGLSSDAIIEVKDREAEFKDLLLRHTEDKTYDELVETEGKQLLCEQYRDLINSYLTRGQVRKVHLKSFIIKP